MTGRVNRRSYVKYAASGIVAAAVVGVGYYYFAYRPRPTVTPTATPTPTPTTTTSTLNPVVKYALDRGIDPEVANRLDVLSELNENNKTLVDYLYSTGELVPPEEVRSLQIEVLDGSKGFNGILTDEDVSDEEANALRYLSSFPKNVQIAYIDFGVNDTVSSYLSSLYASSSDFARWATERRLCIKDHEITDLEESYLHEHERYGKELFDTYILDSSAVCQELSDEMKKLPDLKEPAKENIHAIEGIICSYKYLDHKTAFERMIDEGIKDKRKYCTPLQALTWILYDGYDEKILEECIGSIEKESLEPLSRLLNHAWLKTSTSKQYTSERWKNFDEVVDRLNSPDLISVYMWNNIRYEDDPENINQSALTTFNKKAGDCEDHAMFGLYCLIENGYAYDNFSSYSNNAACGLDVQWGKIGSPNALGHAVCLYKTNSLFYYLDNRGVKRGPYKSVDDVVNSINSNWRRYAFFNTNFKITKEVRR